MTSKMTTKAASPKTSSPKTTKTATTRTARKKSNRINRQRRLQKQLQALLLERHSRRCIICHHPEREAIEEEFVHWRAPWKLAQDYKLADYRTIYRHARAAGLLRQRRERLHSALDAFVESVDDVTFTGDTILRAMRAYTCIDSHGRWTEIPTQVQFSTSTDAHPPQPGSPSPRSGSSASGILDIVPKYSNRASRSDTTACAAFSAHAVNATEDDYADPEYDDSDDDPDEESEDDADNALEERVTALRASSKSPSRSDTTACSTSSKSMSRSDATACSTSSKSMSRSDATACADAPAQAVSATEDDYADPEDDDNPDDDMDDDPNHDPDDQSKEGQDKVLEVHVTACAAPPAQPAVPLSSNQRGRTVTASASSKTRSRSDATACADSPAQALPRDVVRGQNPNHRSLSDRTDSASTMKNAARHAAHPNRSSLQQETGRGATATACADSPAQALPRDVVRGQNPNHRSPSDRTDSAASPRPLRGTPAQPAAPPKPRPDANGLIWHPHPGYPNQEISEPDAEGRVMYKLHITPAATQLPSRETDAQRAAKLIYRSVIKNYGNP